MSQQPPEQPPPGAPAEEEAPPGAEPDADAPAEDEPEDKPGKPKGGKPADGAGAGGETEADGDYYVIQDAGDPAPWALVAVRPRGLYELWTGDAEGWVDMPYFAAYFVGGEIGARQIEPAQIGAMKRSIKAPPAAAVAMLRGDDKRVGGKGVPSTAPSDNGPDEPAEGEEPADEPEATDDPAEEAAEPEEPAEGEKPKPWEKGKS